VAEERRVQFPLFIDYGQKARDRELSACLRSMKKLRLPEPSVVDLAGYGALIASGLTDPEKDVVADAFTPGRNALFLLVAASYAVKMEAGSVAIGLLDEQYRLFPDQSKAFLDECQKLFAVALGTEIAVIAPLMHMSKADVVKVAKQRGLLAGTYSCHEGREKPCGRCIACREFEGTGV
jgi:7-cyano-7-deazaguanine synthase